MTNPTDNSPWSSPAPSGSIDPMLQARLDRLAQRNAAIPPAPTAASQASSSAAPSARTNAPKMKRRHAAKGSRSAALAISLTATGALSAMFALSNGNIATANGAVATTAASRSLNVSVPVTAAASVATSAPTAVTAPATSAPVATTASTAKAAAVAPTPAATTATTAKAVATTVAAATSTGLKNGQYTGSSIGTKWGPVQVAITIAGGKITDVVAVDVPMDRSKSIQINNRATPVLRSEALAAQSSKVANVSGATYTSNGYAASLQSAIDMARSGAAAVTA